MDATKVINMSKFLESNETTMIGTDEATRSMHVNYLCKHARTMCMMFEASNDTKYLEQAKKDIALAHQIKAGFMRPIGAIKSEAA